MSDAVSSLLNRSLDDIIAESRAASTKAPAGKAPRTAKAPRAPRADTIPDDKPKAAPADPTAVHVANLAWSVTQDALTAFMGSAGTVVSAEIPLNAAGKSKGHAVVKFESAEAALKAVETLNDAELEGRKVAVRQDRPKVAAPPQAAAARAPAAKKAGTPAAGGVYIGNLGYSVTEEELTNHLRTVGKVVSVNVRHGWAVATFANAKSAAAAVTRLTDTELGGRKIFVREDREPPAAPGGPVGRAGRSGEVTVIKQPAGPAVAVTGLPFDITADELRGIFSSVGATSAVLTSARGGAGSVTFRSPAQAERAATEFNGALVNGRAIAVRVK